MSGSNSTGEPQRITHNIGVGLTRAAFPRSLMVYEDKSNLWHLCTDENILASIEYLAVSYRQADFSDRAKLEEKIQDACHHLQLSAYWLDVACTGNTMEEKDNDLYRIADVFRGASKTLILISGDDDQPLSQGWLRWGDRVWTLPEALLSLELLYRVGSRPIKKVSMRRLANLAYKDRHEEMKLIDGHSGREPLPLPDRVKLLYEAIWKRSSGPDAGTSTSGDSSGGVFTAYLAERVYALMGFLSNRIVPDSKETEAAAFSRLMKTNNVVDYSFYAESSTVSITNSMSKDTLSEIASQTIVVRQLPYNHPNIASETSWLAYLHWTRWKETMKIEHLNQCITHAEDALFALPKRHSSRLKYAINASVYLTARYNEEKKPADLDLAISYGQESIALMDDGDSNKIDQLENVALLSWKRWERLRRSSDWTRAVNILQSLLQLVSYDFPRRGRYHEYLGSLYQDHYRHSSKKGDLDHAINHRSAAVHSVSETDALRPKYLWYLADSLWARFEEKGSIGDLDQSITAMRDSIRFVRSDILDKAKHHHFLCILFHERYDRLHKEADLDQAILNGRVSVRSLREINLDVPVHFLEWLSYVLRIRFKLMEKSEDEEEANGYNNEVRVMKSPDKVGFFRNMLSRRRK